MKKLLIVYQTQTGNTGTLAEQVSQGATSNNLDVQVKMLKAGEAVADDLLWCHGVLFGTPENFGYMSGAMKDFLDRVYYPLQGKIQGLPYAVFISAGNDGSGALRSLRRIVKGFPLKEVMEPVIARGNLDDTDLKSAWDLGLSMGAGLDAGIY